MKKIFNKTAYRWKFARVGGIDRVCIDKGSDLMNLDQLDQKLWTALSCPIYGLELDSKTLELMDADSDGRLRVNEIITAIKWIGSILKNPDDLINSGDKFPLSAINTDNPEGKQLYESAKQILHNIGRPDDEYITVEETSDTVKIFASTLFNGDGIIISDSADNEEEKECINDIINCCGSVTDRSGNPGISLEIIEKFFEECKTYSNWQLKAETDADLILPFGENTDLCMQTFDKLKAKIDDYFLRCKLAEFDNRSPEIFNQLMSRYENISAKNLTECIDEIANFPLAFTAANQELQLTKEINPAWQSEINDFKTLIADVLFNNKKSITESDWLFISEKFTAYKNWISEKPLTNAEILGLEKIHKYLNSNIKSQLILLIDKDIELQEEADSISKVDQLVRYYRDLYVLLKNFVSFNDFYARDQKAIFQAGTLYIDRRSCDLCLRVNDVAKHSVMANLSGMYLMYCECVSRSKGETMQIVVALTNGDIDNLIPGRNGVFYDRSGNDWDATITKIIENPVSIRQAFWSPYRKASKMIGNQIEKFAAAKEKSAHDNMASGVEQGTKKVITEPANAAAKPADEKPAPTKASEAFDIGKFVGIFAAISMAIGAIGTALVAILAGFFKLTWWQMPLAMLGIMLLISGPSMILAYLKLRKRNLAPLLDANGWAINARALINIYFGRTLTAVATLPPNSERNLIDPYSKKKSPVIPITLIIIALAAIAIYILCLNGWSHCPIKMFFK